MNLVRAMHGRLPAVVVKYELPCMRASVTVGSGWYLLEDGDLFWLSCCFRDGIPAVKMRV